MAASNALESRIFASSVFRFTRVNQVLELGVDDMENEEQNVSPKVRHGRATALTTMETREVLVASPGSSTVGQALQVVALAPCQRT